MDNSCSAFFSRLLSNTRNTICTEYTSITYEGLNNSIDSLTSKLLSLGINSGDTIAVCVNCPIDFIISSLSVFKLGCIILPLDPYELDLKNQTILSKGSAAIMLTNSDSYLLYNVRILNIKGISSEKADISIADIPNSYEITLYRPYYESESEGIIINSNIIENWLSFNKEILNISFEKSAFIYKNYRDMFSFIWMSVINECGTLYIYRDALQNNTNLQDGFNIESIIMPLSLLPDIYYKATGIDTLKHIVTFGEDLYDTAGIKDHLHTSGVKWHNYFGFPYIQMISAITDTLQENTKYMQHEGKLIKNTTGYILDETLSPQPVGIPGELYVSSPAKYSFINNEMLQNDLIMPDSYKEGNYLFKAGYKAKLLSNGRFHILEHSDGSIFINGSYGSLHEINRIIQSVPIVKESVTAYHLQELFIYYVPCENISLFDVISYLKQHLSYIYFPLHLIPVNQIPKDEHGNANLHLLQENRTLSSIECSNLELEILKIPLDDCAVIPFLKINELLSFQPVINIYCVSGSNDNLIKNKIRQTINIFLSQTISPGNNLTVNCYLVDNLPRKSDHKSDIDFEVLLKSDKLPLFTNDPSQNTPSELENGLLEIWRNLLNRPTLNITDNFFSSGGTSLLLTKMLFLIREKFGINIPFRTILSAPTVQKLARYLNGDLQEEVAVPQRFNFSEDVLLDSSIKSLAIYARSPAKELNNILLTGSTGFIGAYLLNFLIKYTHSNIYCLVRSHAELDAKAKIAGNLNQYGLFDSYAESRIFPVLGDLTLPRLGIASEQYKDLTEKIDAIYHIGALVNFSYPYDALKPANVEGIKEVLRFAATKKIKHIHHVSTLAVYSALTGGEIINEDYPLDLNTSLKTGYSQSKLVSDCIVQSARAFGLPCTIYRICTAIGDTNTGACQTKDLFWLLMKACISLKMFPDIDLSFNLIPVDRLAESIVRLSLKEKPNDQNNYHLDNHRAVPIPDIVAWLREYGYSIELVSYDDWYASLVDYLNSSEDASLLLLLSSFPQSRTFFDKVKHVEFMSKKTASRLAEIGIPITPLSQKEFNNNISYFIGIDFLPEI